jgi:hypothetical protein
MARGKVTATPCNGVNMPLSQFSVTYDGPDQPPEDAIIGECVGEAVRRAWRAGHDPAVSPFIVVVTFQ